MDRFDIFGELENDDDEEIIWNSGGKDATIFLIDCSQNMVKLSKEDNDDISYFIKSLRCAHETVLRKINSNDKDLYSVILYNTSKLKNDLDFPNIYVFQDLNQPGAERILELEKLIGDTSFNLFKKEFGSHENTNIQDVLWVCRSLFNKSKSKLATKNILLFTCEDDPHSGDDHKQQQAFKGAKDLREAGIEFEILPLGVHFDINKFYKELLSVGVDESSPSFSVLADPTNRFEELLDRVRQYDKNQRSIGRVPFIIAPGVEMGVKVFTSIRKATKPSKVILSKDTNEELTKQRKVMLNSGEILMPSDFVKYQTYGDKKIKFSLDELKSLSKVYEPGMEILGFKPQSYFTPYLYIKPASFIYPDENSYKGSQKLFSCLLDRCLEKKMSPLIRCVVRQGSSVAWAFLLPQKEVVDDKGCQEKPSGFHVCYLPFADDFRTIQLKNSVRAQSNQVDSAKEVVKSLLFKYSPESFDNPDLQTHWRNIEIAALNRKSVEPVIDYTVPDHARIDKKAGHLINKLKSLTLPNSYNADAAAKYRPPKEPQQKKLKLDVSSCSVEDLAKEKQVEKLTVDKLKMWLMEKGVSVTGKKKAQLVQDVYDELNDGS